MASSAASSGVAPTQDLDDDSSLRNGYRLPPEEIIDIIDAPLPPRCSFSPHRDKILFLKRRSSQPLTYLARPEEKLAGLRIDGSYNAQSRIDVRDVSTGLEIHTLLDDGTVGPGKVVHGFPDGAMIKFISWSPDGQHLSFIPIDEKDSSSKLCIWVAEVGSGEARPLFKLLDIRLNAIFDNYVWVDNSTMLVGTIPPRGSPPKKPLVPPGPKVQSNEEKNVIQARTYQDLLKDGHDEDLFDYYATSQLVLASLDGTTKPIGLPAVYTSIKPSPDKKYILVTSIHRPYSFVVPYRRFPKKVELWTADGNLVKEICDLPLAEDIPIASDSERKGERLINWRADKPSTLYWVKTQDEGDVKAEISPRDIVYMQSADSINDEKPEIFHKLDLRYSGISWCDDSLALVYESWNKTKTTRTWAVSPGRKDISPRILFDRSSEDAYSNPGSPMTRTTQAGTSVVAKIKKDGKSYLLLNGIGASSEGNIPFLDLFDIDTRSKERIWESDKDKYYERVVQLMSSDYKEDELDISKLKLLISKESKTENTQYYLQNWSGKRYQITNFPHPYPKLASLQKEKITYSRNDDVELKATLYLPPGYDVVKDGARPCLVWSYPREFKNKDAASQVRDSPNEFSVIDPTSPLLWLAGVAGRFAVLYQPTIPIIGEGDIEANDSYTKQLVASAEAAVEEVVRRGVADRNRIAIGGHSYGALMTANLLVHAPHLFSCGIARSGAYNRTLTPFGFQNEERTLWQATSTYIEMSPLISANKIKKPILLVHGEEDSNPGTLTMQSDRFFSALRGLGAICRSVILPSEDHNYSARESIMHVFWESDQWLQTYCVKRTNEVADESHSATRLLL